MASAKPPRKIVKTGYDPNLMWGLDTENIVEGRTWWWWWWIFFIKDPKHPGRTRQLMVLHSTKNADQVVVMDHTWKRAYKLARSEENPKGSKDPVRKLAFHGMSAAWWFDGEKMTDPWLLKDLEFDVYDNGGPGSLTVKGRDDIAIHGDGTNYTVLVADDEGKTKMKFEMEPWTPWLSEHRYTRSNIWRNWGYDIMKIHAMKMRGELTDASGATEKLEGTAYFQKVRVNAPSTPWYWVVLHAENGLYMDYFKPTVGSQMWRRTVKQRSVFDKWWWAEIAIKSNVEVYDPGTQTLHTMKDFKLRHRYPKGSKDPIFVGKAEGPTARVTFTLETYARAYWRFQQKHLGGLVKSILYYNEYPAELTSFEFEDLRTGRKLTRADLGFVAANCEQTWGKLY